MTAPHAAAFLGSFLLFESELLAAKLLLPRFGGGAHVWTACMMFFQAALLAGYLYAHLASTRLSPRAHGRLHLGVLLLAALSFPIDAARGGAQGPLASLLLALAATVGAPFFALSATVTTLQRWAGASGRSRGDPYVLYAASNAGALAGLIGYPLLIEPLLSVKAQVWLWQAGYFLFIGGKYLCLPRSDRHSDDKPAGRQAIATACVAVPPGSEAPAVSLQKFLSWILLSAGPCAAMLAATSYLTSSLAAVPLLWMLPLAIYLATFIANFKQHPWRPRVSRYLALLLVSLAGGLLLAAYLGRNVQVSGVKVFSGLLSVGGVALNLAALFIVAMISHRSLSDSKPAQAGLESSFYLCVSIGGAVAGVLLGLMVPLLCRSVGLPALDWMIAGVLCLGALVARDWALWRARSGFAPAALASCGALGLVLLLTARGGPSEEVFAVRNFYGISRVLRQPPFVMLFHGNTLHGLQYKGQGAQDAEPLAYFHRLGPLGDAFRLFGREFKDVGSIGLGAGAVAAYGTPGTKLTFYELDPDVVDIARTRFTYLSACKADLRFAVGDARLSLGESRGTAHDLLIIDAFTGGAIPAHLLTREAFELYLDRLAPGGVILCHVSNRFLDLKPVLAALSADLGLPGAFRIASPPLRLGAEYYGSQWVALSRDAAKIRRLETEAGWKALSTARSRWVRLWTDRYASVLPLIRF